MDKYNYEEAILNDVLEAISDNEYQYSGLDRDELEEKLNDELWIDDAVTGNGSGSYTFNAFQAGLNLVGNYYLLHEACDEFGCNVPESEEAADVTIRCYLLSQAIAEALDELEADGYFEEAKEA